MSNLIRLLAAAGMTACLAQATNAQAPRHAAPPDAFRHITDAELAKLSSGPGALTLCTLADHENFYVLVAGRTGPGEVEIHRHWADYMAIQQGEAEFTSGGAATGTRVTGEGELRGGTIAGGKTVTLRPGDFVMVPAGEPHLTTIKPGSPFRAIVFKLRQ
jgi:mannose-6-phosphate isomerase-like protein (cupin superfamily)